MSEERYRVPMSSADLDQSDYDAVLEVLHTGRLALGPKSEEFERRIAEYVGVEHAVTVNSGTSALHLIVRGLGLRKGDEVLVPSFTFAASVNALLYEGVTPIFVDIEPDTYNLDPADIEAKITTSTRAIMAVDVFGHPAAWDRIELEASRRGLFVIDDSCEGLGAEFRGKKLGTFGDAAAFAFYPNKQITMGEGGVIVTNDDKLATYARSARNQGRGGGSWLEHVRLGYNYRLDEMSAALGCSQLARIEEILARRAQVAARYDARLGRVAGIRLPVVRSDVRMSWFVYVVTLDWGIDPEKVMAGMEKRGIPVRVYFVPIHEQVYTRDLGIMPGLLPVTDSISGRTIALPFHTNLSPEEVELVASALEASISEAADKGGGSPVPGEPPRTIGGRR